MDMEWVYLYIISQMKTDEVLSQKEIDIIFLKINFPKEIDCISTHYRVIDMITYENIYEFLLLTHIEKILQYKNNNAKLFTFHYFTICIILVYFPKLLKLISVI